MTSKLQSEYDSSDDCGGMIVTGNNSFIARLIIR